MTTFIMAKNNKSFVPTDENGERFLSRIKNGALVEIEIRQPRSLGLHRKLFALMNVVYENQEECKSLDELVDACKLGIGHCSLVETNQGVMKVPKSLSFEAMDNAAFADLYNRALDWATTVAIPGLERSALEREVAAFT